MNLDMHDPHDSKPNLALSGNGELMQVLSKIKDLEAQVEALLDNQERRNIMLAGGIYQLNISVMDGRV